jgi:hypothetical protein
MKRFMPLFLIVNLLCPPSFADSLNDSFDTRGDLTDQQATDSKNFVHQGQRDAIVAKACEDQGLGTCSQSDVNAQGSVFKGDFGQAVEQKIGMLYGLLFGASGFMSGGGPTVQVLSQKDADAFRSGPVTNAEGQKVKKSEKAEEQNDYCIYGAMGYEMISTFIQQGMQTKIESSLQNEQDLQLKSLLALKKTHEARRKTSLYQGTIYAATSACYIARAAASKGRVVMDWKYWAKMSAAAGLSTLYYVKAKKHRLAAEAVGEVIKKLPHAGDCNPWTKTACFCSEPTSKTLYADNFQEVCVLNKGDPETPKIAMGCGVMADGKMTFDKECKCKQTNSCFRVRLSTAGGGLSFGTNYMNDANQGFDMLGGGEFDTAKFDSFNLQAGANASKMKNKIGTTPIPKMDLSGNKKKLAGSFGDLLPPSVAALAANSPMVTPPGGFGNDGVKAAFDKLPQKLKEKIKETEPAKYSSGGPGFESNSEETEEVLGFPSSGESEVKGGTEVLTFAEKAINNADVTNSPDTPIFDIISNRYMRSGINKLKVEESK